MSKPEPAAVISTLARDPPGPAGVGRCSHILHTIPNDTWLLNTAKLSVFQYAFAQGGVYGDGIQVPESDRKACDMTSSIATNASRVSYIVKPAVNCGYVERQLDRITAASGPVTRQKPMLSGHSPAINLSRFTRLRSQPRVGFAQTLARRTSLPTGTQCQLHVATHASQPVR